MIPEQELTVILSFYHSPTYQPSNNNKSQEEEEITKSVENKESVEKNMDNSYLTSSLKSTSTAVLTFHDFDNNSSKETKKSAPKLPLNPPPLIDTGVKSNFKLLREAFEQENIIKNQERKKLETKKMSSSAKLVQEAKISEKRWSSHPERIVEGTPPKPEDNPSTKQGGEVRTAVTGITPFYKSDIEQTKAEVRYGSSHNLQYQSGDYKVKESQEHNRMTIIDPKVNSNSNIPASQIFQQKTLVGDFPSQHTKRSFMNLDPLEQKRFKSLERRPVTTTNYLQESVERHREMEASKLKEYLKTNEKDANKPWDKPDWPGPKQDHSESLRELEQMKHAIETLQKQVYFTRAKSISDLRSKPIPEEDKDNQQNIHSRSRSQDPGWLIRLRKNRYLQNASSNNTSQPLYGRTTSADNLDKTSSRMSLFSNFSSKNLSEGLERLPEKDKDLFTSEEERPDKGGDPILWNHKKQLYLSKYTERRTTFEEIEEIKRETREPNQNPRYNTSQKLPYTSSTLEDNSSSNRVNYHKQQFILPEKLSQASQPSHIPQKQPEHEFHERIMSPTIDRQLHINTQNQPKPILKQNYKTSTQYQEQETGYSYQHYQDAQIHQSNTSITTPKNIQNPLDQSQHFDHRSQVVSPQPRSVSTTFEMLDEEERLRIMHENLMKHRQRSNSQNKKPKYPLASFNGPFFNLEEISKPNLTNNHYIPNSKEHEIPIIRQNDEYNQPLYISKHHTMTKEMSTMEMELNDETKFVDMTSPMDNNGVVIWPPLPKKGDEERPRPSSAMAKSMYDPERRREFERQKQLEYEAISKREKEKRIQLEKQLKAMQLQQKQLLEQQQKMMENEKIMSEKKNYQEYTNKFHNEQMYQHESNEVMKNNLQESFISPTDQHNVRIYETRPISSMSMDNPQFINENEISPISNPTWKRTYLLDSNEKKNIEKNKIITSEELLEKDQYDIDILKRRETFIEKPDKPPEIKRLGKRWQPPPEEPYIWPQLRKSQNIDPDGISRSNSNLYSPPQDSTDEYKWAPVVNDPGYKKENKNFTPQNSPPMSPVKHGGLQTLDEVNKRQIKNLVKPTPDGSHRPPSVFKAIRHTPSGGFYPHAPNGIKIVKRRLHQSHSNLTDDPNYGTEEEDIQIIHERNFHGVDSPTRRVTPMGRSQSVHDLGRDQEEINDWEKIYDLPAHSSTIQGKDIPHNVNLKKRLALFESQANLIQQKYAEKNNRERRTSEINSSSRKNDCNMKVSKGLNRIPIENQTIIKNKLTSEGTRLPRQKQDSKLHAREYHSVDNLKYRSPSVPPTLISSSSGGYHQQPPCQTVGSTHSNHSGSSYSRKQPTSYYHGQPPQQPQPQHHSSTSSGLLRRVDSRTGQSYGSVDHLNQQNNFQVPIVKPRNSRNHLQRPASVTPMTAPEPIVRRIPSRLAQAQISPVPPSYNTARPFIPKPLPDGYRRPLSPPSGYLAVSPRSPPPQNPGQTKRMAQQLMQRAVSTQNMIHGGRQSVPVNLMRPSSTRRSHHGNTLVPPQMHRQPSSLMSPNGSSEAPKKDDLDELSKLNENLIERSKGLKKDFKLVSSEIIKTDPEPVPDMYKEQLREMLESRISTETAPSPLTLNAAVDRSGYVTDASSTNWQFNNSFSPRSIVSINGGTTKDYHPTILKVRTNNIEKRYNRSNSSVTNSLLTTTETEPIVREFTETYSRIKVRNNNESSNIRQGNERIESIRREPVNIIKESLSSPTDDKPRGIIKPVVTKPRITETIKRIEETRRTEEVERRVQRKEKKHRSHRYHHDDHYMTENHYSGDNLEERRKVLSAEEEDEIRNEAKKLKTLHRSSSMRDKKITNYYHKRRRYTSEEFNDAVKSAYEGVNEAYYDYSHRSSSMNRNGMLPIGYYPGYENYNRTSTTRRDYDNGYYDSSHHHMNGDINQQGRYGSSLSDSLRRGDVKYNPNGEIRESYTYGSRGHRRNSNAGYGMHKSYSTRDIIRDSNGGYYGSYFRNPPNQPFVEFPPTLPRRHGEPPIPPPHRSASQMGIESQYRPISKSHSYADWNDQRNQSGNYSYGRKHDEEMSRLENEFRDSLLVPLNNGKGNINDYEHRVEQIPGGFEEYSRSVKGNSGRRLNRDGIPTDFREQSHSYSFHREQTH
uniref:Metalloendopeptidase n=1 Tax=Strongyloides stercoralis TaxID=6248 RepID=A0A0K0EDS4_STRER